MSNIAHLAQPLQELLTVQANRLAVEVGFIRRRRKLTGAGFAQMLLFGWMSNPAASLADLVGTAALQGCTLTKQALDQRLTEKAACFLEALLSEALRYSIRGPASACDLLNRFTGVYLIDSSVITLPQQLASVWAGTGGRTATTSTAALKFELLHELTRGEMIGPGLLDGRCHDQSGPLAQRVLPSNSLRVADLGYFGLKRMQQMHQHGAFFLSRFKHGAHLFDASAEKVDLLSRLKRQRRQGYAKVEMKLWVGATERIACRVLAAPVPKHEAAERRRKLRRHAQRHRRTPSKAQLQACDWTILLTNTPVEQLSFEEAMVLYRVRWQIEMVFKHWKGQSRLERWRSAEPWPILCEIYAKLLICLIRHWITVRSLWQQPRRSLVAAGGLIARMALGLAGAMACRKHLERQLEMIAKALSAGCMIAKRRKRPATFQLLAEPSLLVLN